MKQPKRLTRAQKIALAKTQKPESEKSEKNVENKEESCDEN